MLSREKERDLECEGEAGDRGDNGDDDGAEVEQVEGGEADAAGSGLGGHWSGSSRRWFVLTTF